MKLKNVHYEYRGNDTWRIYFKDYQESEAFENERTDGKKPACGSSFINGKGIQWYVDAKLTGQFNILRRYNKDSAYIFDEIDLWYDAISDTCYFMICCINGTWTEFFVKNMMNSQFGTVAQANGYYDTDTVGQGGLCTRRSCCGIGFGEHRSRYGNTEERIIFTVKNFCRGEADIIKVSAWTNTFIGTNKENEREYSWVDFKQYMQKLSSTGSDIWDIEWKYDATCPMTGTEAADELHVYLKPLAYKRLFEEEKNMGPKDTTFAEFCRRIYWGTIVKPTKILIQGTATIIWWSDGTKTVVKCQKGDKMDPEKGIAMCVMKKFMGTNETGSNYLDFAKDAIKYYEAKQKAMAAARKKAADKKRRAAKKEAEGNAKV